MKLDAIIVEDSRDNLEVLQHFIKKYCPRLNITGTAATIEEAEKLILSQNPDLVFLDIVLDGRKSFELLEQLESSSGINFMIIFVTAHSRFDFAEKAIDYSAVGYLTKPVDKDKLKFAVSKAIRLHPHYSLSEIRETLSQLENKKLNQPEFFKIIKFNQVIKTVKPEEVSHIVAERDISNVCLTNGDEEKSSRSLGFYQQELENHPSFFRIHNQTLVNIRQVSEINRRDNLVILRNGKKLNCSRRMGRALYDYLASRNYD